jgi:predicted RNase H-like HicB family nuclease
MCDRAIINVTFTSKACENMKTRSFTVIVYKEENMHIAECPEIGTVDQGETIEQAIAGVTEATRLYLEEFPIPEPSPRYVTSIEVGYA